MAASNDDHDDLFASPELSNPRRQALARQKVRLTSGAEMELGLARALLDILRETQERGPDQFAALISLVKPGRPGWPSNDASPLALAALRERGFIHRNGSVAPHIAALIDASYKATPEGAILTDPIIYPGRKCYDQLERLDAEWYEALGRLVREEDDRGAGKDRGDDEGPSR